MNIFFRKAIKLGLFRINLSKNGAGISMGPKGIKAGVSPRGGVYIAGGRGGVQFRHNVPTRSKPRDPKEISAAPLAIIAVLVVALVFFLGIFAYFLVKIFT